MEVPPRLILRWILEGDLWLGTNPLELKSAAGIPLRLKNI